MEEARLHQLVQSLTKEQKKNFTRYLGGKVRSRGTSRSKELRLYELMDQHAELDAAFARDLAKLGFSTTQSYYQARAQLGDRIIQSLAAYASKSEKVPLAEFIRQAVLMDVVELATRAIRDRVKEWLAEEDFYSIRYIHDFCRLIKRNFRVVVPLPDLMPGREELEEWILEIEGLEEMLERGKGAWKEGDETRRFMGRRLLGEVGGVVGFSGTARIIKEKIRLMASCLLNDLEAGNRYQERIVEERNRIPMVNVISVIEDAANLGAVSMLTGNMDGVIKSNALLEEAKPKLPLEVWRLEFHVISNLASLGLVFGEMGYAEEGLIRLLTSLELFPESRQIQVFILLASAFAYANDWESTLVCADRLKGYRSLDKVGISWEPNFLYFVAHTAKGNMELAESLFRSSLRMAKTTGAKYPVGCVRLWNRFLLKGLEGEELEREIEKLFETAEHSNEKGLIEILDIRRIFAGPTF